MTEGDEMEGRDSTVTTMTDLETGDFSKQRRCTRIDGDEEVSRGPALLTETNRV